MIPQRNLSLLSNRLALTERRVPEAVLERDYCLSWFLVGLSASRAAHHLAFKGGTALKKCYFGDYRFSEDLDFTLLDEMPFEDLRNGLDEIFESVYRSSAIRFGFDRLDRHPHGNSHTFYLSYEGPLPAQRVRTVKVDITLRELLAFPLAVRPLLRAYPEYSDLPEGAAVHVYSLNEIATEKVVSLLDRGRTEPRDLYDLAFLIEDAHVDLTELRDAIERKLEFRGTTMERLAGVFRAKERQYRRLWEIRLAHQLIQLPPFDVVLRRIRRAFRVARIP